MYSTDSGGVSKVDVNHSNVSVVGVVEAIGLINFIVLQLMIVKMSTWIIVGSSS